MGILVLTTAVFLALLHNVSSTRHVVYWDQDLIPKLSTGGLEINLEVDDYMDVLCPYANPHNREAQPLKQKIRYIRLFNVTKSQYDSCDTRRGIMVQTCDDPYTEKKLTTKFQERSPYPYGFTFIPGATYYYLSKPMEDYSLGCTKDTMRMMIHVRQKGTVFPDAEDHRTRTYHLINRKEPTKHETTSDHGKGRRHHHEKSSQSTTRQTFIYQYETHPQNVHVPRASQVRNSVPDGNSASVPARNPIFSILFSIVVYFLCKRLLQIRATDFH